MKKYERIVTQYERACNRIAIAFCRKQGLEFCFWVSDKPGDIACVSDQYFFGVAEMLHDLNTNQPKGLILSWQEDSVEFNSEKEVSERSFISYECYTTGSRYKL
jgi:hypothetical protein